MSRQPAALAFSPASDLKYECTIHTLALAGDDGRPYRAVLDLIRSDQNPKWGITEDRLALRAAVLNSEGAVIGSSFVDAPKDRFPLDAGQMKIMDAHGHISFVSARGPDGCMLDGRLDFDMRAEILPGGPVQSFADELKAFLEKSIDGLPGPAQEAARDLFSLQLFVTDYPRTQHSGTISVKRPGIEQPLVLQAQNTRSTLSHHYGNSLTEYVFMASVPREGAPSFIAVITQEGIDLNPNKVGPEVHLPVGYLLRTDVDGHTSFSLLRVDADKGRKKGVFNLGSDFLGISLDVDTRHEAGSVALNEGKLPTRTAFGRVTIQNHAILGALGLTKGETFEDVVIDVTGRFLVETGRDSPL